MEQNKAILEKSDESKKEFGYKCVQCGAIKKSGTIAWRVMRYSGNGVLLFSPTCSEKCASIIQENNVKIHWDRAKTIERQCIQKMRWED